eukprot:scaffold20363_cov128-Isochrysis_galbana.AAC.3
MSCHPMSALVSTSLRADPAPRARTRHTPCPLLCVSRYAVGLLTLCRMRLYCAAYCVGVGVGTGNYIQLQLQLPVVAVRGAWWLVVVVAGGSG